MSLEQEDCLDLGQSDMSSGTCFASESLGSESGTDVSMTHPFSAISEHSLVKGTPKAIRVWLMSLRQDSPASRFPSQEDRKGRTTSGTCGQPQQTLFALSSHDTFCLRMCQEYANTCPWSSETCADLATEFADPSSLGLTIAEARTGERESGYWLTPNAMDALAPRSEEALRKQYQKNRSGRTTHSTLREQVVYPAPSDMWPTPSATPRGPHKGTRAGSVEENCRVSANGTKWGMTLETAVVARSQFPSPRASDAKGSGPVGSKSQKHMSERQYLCGVVATEESGALNPDWVEALMAWPIGWTSLNDLKGGDFAKWLDACQWEEWEPDIPRVARGVRDRVHRLMAIGNGQVPIVVATAWRLLKGDVSNGS